MERCLRCNYCERQFKTEVGLFKHLQKLHFLYKCLKCDKDFASIISLKRHVGSHSTSQLKDTKKTENQLCDVQQIRSFICLPKKDSTNAVCSSVNFSEGGRGESSTQNEPDSDCTVLLCKFNNNPLGSILHINKSLTNKPDPTQYRDSKLNHVNTVDADIIHAINDLVEEVNSLTSDTVNQSTFSVAKPFTAKLDSSSVDKSLANKPDSAQPKNCKLNHVNIVEADIIHTIKDLVQEVDSLISDTVNKSTSSVAKPFPAKLDSSSVIHSLNDHHYSTLYNSSGSVNRYSRIKSNKLGLTNIDESTVEKCIISRSSSSMVKNIKTNSTKRKHASQDVSSSSSDSSLNKSIKKSNNEQKSVKRKCANVCSISSKMYAKSGNTSSEGQVKNFYHDRSYLPQKDSSLKPNEDSSLKPNEDSSLKLNKESSPKTNKDSSPKTNKVISFKTSKDCSPKKNKNAKLLHRNGKFFLGGILGQSSCQMNLTPPVHHDSKGPNLVELSSTESKNKDSVSTESKNKESVGTESKNKESVSTKSKNKESVSTESKNKESVSTESKNKESVSTESKNKESVSTESKNKESELFRPLGNCSLESCNYNFDLICKAQKDSDKSSLSFHLCSKNEKKEMECTSSSSNIEGNKIKNFQLAGNKETLWWGEIAPQSHAEEIDFSKEMKQFATLKYTKKSKICAHKDETSMDYSPSSSPKYNFPKDAIIQHAISLKRLLRELEFCTETELKLMLKFVMTKDPELALKLNSLKMLPFPKFPHNIPRLYVDFLKNDLKKEVYGGIVESLEDLIAPCPETESKQAKKIDPFILTKHQREEEMRKAVLTVLDFKDCSAIEPVQDSFIRHLDLFLTELCMNLKLCENEKDPLSAAFPHGVGNVKDVENFYVSDVMGRHAFIFHDCLKKYKTFSLHRRFIEKKTTDWLKRKGKYGLTSQVSQKK